MGRELLPPIRDDFEGESVILEDMVEVQLGSLFGRDIGTGGTEMCHLRQAVDAYVNGIEPGRWWELDDEVHGHRLPRALWNWERVELSVRGMARGLIPGAGLTGLDVIVDELSHPRPMIIARDYF